MSQSELAHLKLLAEVDALLARLTTWVDDAPSWEPAEMCGALVARLTRRTENLKIRMEAPLVVATLGGTGTGKSTLVNAILGKHVVKTGRRRPTTNQPTMVCRPDISPEILGIDPRAVELINCDLPALADMVLIDCPDPDTTEVSTDEQAEIGNTNLARLRQLLPHCDVLLVTTTQQKYRSARVTDELAAAASAARLVFVQTHADRDNDIREDWAATLDDQYVTSHVFLIDSLAALDAAEKGMRATGEFSRLVQLLTSELAGAAGNRIRRANFLDLVDEVLATCDTRLTETAPRVERVEQAVAHRREVLTTQAAEAMRTDLAECRRHWENRLLGQVVSHWGFSPFAMLLRLFQGLGGLVFGGLLFRARTPAQMALLGAVEGLRTWQKRRQDQQANQGTERAVADCWDQAELHEAAIVLEGYAVEAGLPRKKAAFNTICVEADQASVTLVRHITTELEAVLGRLAKRHTGWFTRWRYEAMLLAMGGALTYRLGRNFFYESWYAGSADVYGLDFYLSAGFWLLLWCLILLWLFLGRLRRGLRRELNALADRWREAPLADDVFAALQADCADVGRFRRELAELRKQVGQLRRHLALPEGQLGHRR